MKSETREPTKTNNIEKKKKKNDEKDKSERVREK